MAKSKSGGTRAYIRGRVGSDVYSIGKTAKGKKQQVVRSLAETVANPQTTAQMRGRMIMSTIMQAVAAMSAIIDHSFDGLPKGQPSISEFISVNYGLIKADVAAHPAAGNSFGLVKYQEKGAKYGAYQVSKGDVVAGDYPGVSGDDNNLIVQIPTNGNFATIGGALLEMNLAPGDYFTAVAISADGKFHYLRVKVADEVDGTKETNKANLDAIFTFEGSAAVTTSQAGAGDYSITMPTGANSVPWNAGIILSKKTDEGWKHNTCVLDVTNVTPVYTADVALPTYPTRNVDFLNGGDIF